jgi:hypothetical protein
MIRTTNLKLRWPVGLLAVSLLLPLAALAQSDDGSISLGDLARSLRKSRELPSHSVIDNDNLTQVVDDAETRKLTGASMLYSIDEAGKGFKVSSPDVTCSLSFSAQASSLLSDPFVAQELPAGELLKLDGPASLKDNALEINVYNGSDWSLREITVGLTIVRHTGSNPTAAKRTAGRLIPASAIDPVTPSPAEKRSDMTVLYHLKGTAAPSTTTIFREILGSPISDQDWHWAIVQAKGIPPQPKLPE